MTQRPPAIAGLRHVALKVRELEACLDFYTRLLGYRVEWRPDDDNVYLTSGCDNLALHRDPAPGAGGALDHLGIILERPAHVDAWFEYLRANGAPIDAAPATHRDGARSFYCRDPAGTRVQMIYHPPLAGGADDSPLD